MEIVIVNEEEVEILLGDLLAVYGYDFSDYARASLLRRVNRLFSLDKFNNFSAFRERLKTDEKYMGRFVEQITVNVTEMFRDPSFYKVIKNEILPVLSTYPFIRIWHAGCSTGEEVYSMAILLKEANLLHKSLLYATDINAGVLDKARKGIFPISQMKQYSENYIQSGGKKNLSDYYTARYEYAKFNDDLNRNMILSTHNLVSDRSFNEFQLILCRNVLIYFDKALQDRVLTLFDDSLEPLCYLALGMKENLKFSPVAGKYQLTATKEKIWRKMK